jgi:hypothetical protein
VKVFVKGQGEVTLSKADFVGGGGEGSVYAKGSTAIKLYTDPRKMIPIGKIGELAKITDPNVIKPERVVLDKRNTPIGYTMRFLKTTHALCELFPPAFRTRNGITPQMMLDLIQSLQERIRNVHAAGILVVDLNEMNFLVDPKFTEVYAIDVDSYQTPHYPATAIMESIRDPQVRALDFTENSDWFSFAVVAFNLFCGIHPYKGKHPILKGFPARMQAGVSVFNKDVKVPKVVLPFDVIPDAYRAWLKAVLEDGKRLPPPGDLRGAIVIAPVVRTVTGTNTLDIVEILALTGDVRGLWASDGGTLVWTDDGLYMGNRRLHGSVSGVAGVGFSPKNNRPVIAGTSGGTLKLFDVEGKAEIPTTMRADDVMSHNGRVYVRNRNKILEIVLQDVGGRVIAASKSAGTCLEHATRLYHGVAIQNLLGATWASLFPASGKTYQLHIEELDEYRVVDARYDNASGAAETGVLMVVGVKDGKYDRLVFRFDGKFKEYDVRVIEDVTPTGLNFVVLDTGVCICLTEDENLELISCRMGSTGMKVVDDPVLGGDMRLHKEGGRVVFPKGSKVFSMGLK